MTYQQYMTYIKFACDEELQRMHEYLYGLENDYDQSEDKYYVKHPSSCCPPDFDEAQALLQGRDMANDFNLMSSGDEEAKEELYSELRNILLYS